MPLPIKICGLTTQEAIDTSITYGASYLGFIFYPPSPRNITPGNAAKLTTSIPKVAVTVSMDDSALDQLLSIFAPDILQLHGNESPERVRELKKRTNLPIIKALQISTKDNLKQTSYYQDDADFLLFDAKPPKGAKLPGGNGIAFDWTLLKNTKFERPWFLSGGLTCQNLTEAVKESGAVMLDVSSGVESAPGIKDRAKIQDFLTLSKLL